MASTQQLITSCAKVPAMVGRLCESIPGEPFGGLEFVDAREIPQPYRRLLEHTSDMTSTLTEYHGEPIRLRVLSGNVTPQTLARRSVLELAQCGRPVELGIIEIQLGRLDPAVRAEVLEGREPLGGLLNAHGLAYRSCPGGFLRVRTNEIMNEVFGLAAPTWLYGRCNCLSAADGRPIAEVIEILPPETANA